MRLFLLGILFLFPGVIFSQSKERYIGSKGETILTVDSLSFKDKFLFSRYYIDSVSQLPYSGVLLAKYGKYAFDSLMVENGYLNGFQTYYNVCPSQKSTEVIFSINQKIFYNQSEKVRFIRHISCGEDGKGSGGIRCFEETGYVSYFLSYRKNKIKLIGTIRKESKTQKKRLKFKTYEELESFFKEKNYYKLCKELGFFKDSF